MMIPEEVKQFIGRTDPPIIRHVEKGAIRRYAEAVGVVVIRLRQ